MIENDQFDDVRSQALPIFKFISWIYFVLLIEERHASFKISLNPNKIEYCLL